MYVNESTYSRVSFGLCELEKKKKKRISKRPQSGKISGGTCPGLQWHAMIKQSWATHGYFRSGWEADEISLQGGGQSQVKALLQTVRERDREG